MREYVITARGEMSPEQLGIVERYLGRQGLRTEILETAIEPRLGGVGFEDFRALAAAEGFDSKLVTRAWMTLRRSEGMDYPYGMGIGIELFDGSESLNLDAASQVVENRLIDRIPNFGTRAEELLKAVIESRAIQPTE